ncbi:MAG: hypothetical protein IT260_07045 [Saprospiraceae bacterium]|nr:hypothetical protein [Saprospiraceae bacterium]
MNFRALEFLEQQLRPQFKVFEFGGGGSTLFFCKKVAEVVTVEDHEAWFGTLTQKINTKNYSNWKGHFQKPEPVQGNATRSPQNPADFMSGAKGLEHLSFERYARTIEAYPTAYFDVILVDGRARPSCIQQAIPHLKPQGLLVVDNTERPYYLAAFGQEFAAHFTLEMDLRFPVAYTPDFTQTTILRKK